MTKQFSFNERRALRSRGLLTRGLLTCGVALVLAACSDLGVFRGGPDVSNGPSSTINGNAINTSKAAPPVPQRRTSNALIKASQKENKRIIAAYGGVYTNRQVENQLAQIVSRLVAKSEDPSQRFQITILNSPTVNAFALPGGFLYITRGLIALANDGSEVAAVLAHEMAHVTSQHGQQRLQQARKSEIVAKAVQGVISDTSTIESIRQQRQLAFAAFTQQQELDADQVGVRNSALAGYDPFAASRFLKTMADYQSYRTTATVAKSNDGPNFLSSHPSTPSRIKQAQVAARQFGAPGFGTSDKQAYLQSIDSMIFGDDPAEGFVRDRSFYHPQLLFTFSVPSGYVIENTREAVLATAGNGDAVRFDGVDLPVGVTLSQYLTSGWLNGLDPSSISSFTVNGSEAASATAAVNNWSFKITVIRSAASTYRMIFATQAPSTLFDRAVSSTVSSFRTLTRTEARNLSPLRIRIVKVKRSDSVNSLSGSMRGLVANPPEAFMVLNGLRRGQKLEAGSLVKVIYDGNSG